MSSFFAPSWYFLSWDVLKGLWVEAFALAKRTIRGLVKEYPVVLFFSALLYCVGVFQQFIWVGLFARELMNEVKIASTIATISPEEYVKAFNSKYALALLLVPFFFAVYNAVFALFVLRSVRSSWFNYETGGAVEQKQFRFSFFLFVALVFDITFGCLSLFFYNEATGRPSTWQSLWCSFVMGWRFLPAGLMFLPAVLLVKVVSKVFGEWVAGLLTPLLSGLVLKFGYFVAIPFIVPLFMFMVFTFFFQVAHVWVLCARLRDRFPEVFAEEA